MPKTEIINSHTYSHTHARACVSTLSEKMNKIIKKLFKKDSTLYEISVETMNKNNQQLFKKYVTLFVRLCDENEQKSYKIIQN